MGAAEAESKFWDTIESIKGNFVVYGCGEFGTLIITRLRSRNMMPLGVCDGNSVRHGERFHGFSIMSPKDAVSKFGSSVMFLVAIYGDYGGERHMQIQRELAEEGCFRTIFFPIDMYIFLSLTQKQFTQESLASVLGFRKGLTLRNGAFFALDQSGKDCFVADGERRTCHTPEHYERDMYIIGSSVAFSTGMPDEDTLASYLQCAVNNGITDKTAKFRIRNFGSQIPFPEHVLLQAMAINIKPGDYLIAIVHSRGSIKEQCSALLAVHRYCREKSCHFIAALMPYPQMFREYPQYLVPMRRIREEVRPATKHRSTHEEIRRSLLLEHAEKIRILHSAGCPVWSSINELEDMEQSGIRVFIDLSHLSAAGNKLAADSIYREAVAPALDYLDVQPRALFAAAMGKLKNIIGSRYKLGEMDSVKRWFAGLKRSEIKSGKKYGAIVMNCNPFTIGHLHVAQIAANSVDLLYVFVVEADRSEYSFADRLHMVEKGLSGLDNVIVNPSGEFILSSMTFDEYFGKAAIIDIVDSSLDIAVFGAVIGPELGITVRFAGEEPICNVTRQYNETMRRMLPPMGIEFREIPRLCLEGEPISASRVRQLVQKGDWRAIQDLVPAATYEYLATISGNSSLR